MPDTQQTIIDAAILVFNEDYSAPLEKVAERAAITRRTLHRYFTGRDELLASCARDMQRRCNQAMAQALDSSDVPLVQLENMLYAGVECGAKYSFLSKLHNRPEHLHNPQNPNCAHYDAMMTRYRGVVSFLIDEGTISRELTVEWVTMLFRSVISATVNAEASGTVARTSLKHFAWFSFSKGIGV
ncbi:TetR/AcrR family transcriptional regulator [Hymenobacter sp. BT175]|uniref:TetR/AcrR family transcriptional regulator n=1 Tax=Hymenobacter translucens TaxID=2886507 RepID=UPI001D0F0B2F|nr:TetR/AcrR family transcriptional regulator [Hymenobacter translucens]MCC2547034.1 TetR/AcrR family transcriptional regulator [Hymenobacter translucens]